MTRDFFRAFLSASLRGGPDNCVGPVKDVFQGPILSRLEARFEPQALDTPVVFTDHLRDRTYAALIISRDRSLVIAINARFRVDPEYLAHSVVEELAHAQQFLDGVDFGSQCGLPYSDRSYEIEAKRLASEILGYEPSSTNIVRRRPEPPGALYVARDDAH